MEEKNRTYVAIDLKSFYASVECFSRALDPLDANLVVADVSRTEKTICLAVTPALKAYGIPGRARLFEVTAAVREINAERLKHAPGHKFTGKSHLASELKNNPSLELDFVAAPPRMRRYMEVSNSIYSIYLRYLSPEDIHVYSIDEVIMDVTEYLPFYKLTAHELAMKIIKEVLFETGITATAGIGTNMYLCKVAMDIVAKHIPADKDGVRIAELDEMSYRRLLWNHRPITDFWRVGRGYARKLESKGLFTMGDIARCSIGDDKDFYNENLLFDMFGINAELLIDHAWGYENCLMKDIKAYKPENSSLSSGQVLSGPYEYEKAKLVMREMTDALVLDMVEKNVLADQMVITIGYDRKIPPDYKGAYEYDHYGRMVPEGSHGSINLGKYTSSGKLIIDAVMQLFDQIVNKKLYVRRMYVVANHIMDEQSLQKKEENAQVQLNLFTDYEMLEKKKKEEKEEAEKEKKLQKALLGMKKKYGKNAILRGMDLEEGATTIERNNQVGGHKA